MARTAIPRDMAAQTSESGAGESEGNGDDVQWASQQEYQQQTAETDDVILPDGQMKMRIVIMQPAKFASLLDEYRITDMAEDMADVPEQADISDSGDVDLDDLAPEDLEEVNEKLRVMLFFRDVILPQVVRPEKVHWANPDHIGDPDWFDLSDLTDRDLTFLVGKVTGQDPEQLMGAAQDRVESFQK